MATAAALRSEIEAARATFRAALEGAAADWERTPGGEEWSRREVAEHTIGTDYSFAGWALTLTGGTRPERPELALRSNGEALAAFAASSTLADGAWAGVQAEDLQKEVRPERTVEAAMQLVASHLRDHAEQLGAS